MAVIPPEQDGWRLDRVVAALPDVGSRKRAKMAIETGKVSVDGNVVGSEHLASSIAAGTTVDVDWNRRGLTQQVVRARRAVKAAGIDILYVDDHVIAVNKPAGMLTDSATFAQRREEDSLRQHVAEWLRKEGQGVHLVHRIDRDTTGVVLIARTEDAEEHLRDQFRARSPERVYRAIVNGVPRPAEGEWADWMRWDANRRLQRITPPNVDGSVRARCRYRTVAVFGDAAEIEVRLVTGRRNQIRLQAADRGHPLAGEKQYLPDDWGKEDSGQPRRKGERSQARSKPMPGIRFERQALHALRLVVKHPATGERLIVEAPVPEDFSALRKKLQEGGRSRRRRR